MDTRTTVVLDFETDDPYIAEEKGAGWAYAGPDSRFKVLGAAYKVDNLEVVFTTDFNKLQVVLSQATDVVCHNAQYDIGTLNFLNIQYDHLRIHDTLLLAKLLNNDLIAYSLDALGEKYLGRGKQEDGLGEVARRLKLIKNKTQDAGKVAKKNMGLIFKEDPATVAKYAIVDVELTYDLYKMLKEVNTEERADFYSDLIKALVKSRARGVLVDLTQARKLRDTIYAEEKEALAALDAIAPGCNFNSAKQLAEVFDSNGWEYPLTEKGSPSFKGEWLEEQTANPLAATLCRYRKLNKVRNDFLDSVLEGTSDDQQYKTVHGEVAIFGASQTGRVSFSHPNLQQIPKRDPELGKIIRTIYIPHPGETWYSLDFSSQESRIQLHYAYLIQADGARTLVEAFRKDPALDIHGMVARMAKITRNEAKTINLGLSYGMGLPKLADSLGMAYNKASIFLREFHRKLPYLKALTEACKASSLKRGYIKTIGGRHLRVERNFVFKAMNKLIQGSAADQTYAAMVQCYREGIPVMFPVHDSLELSGTLEQALRVKQIMEECMPMELPSLAEIECGHTWGDCDKIDIKSTEKKVA